MFRWLGRLRETSRGSPTKPEAVATAQLFVTSAAHQRLTGVLSQTEGSALRLFVKNPGAGTPQYDMAIEVGPAKADDIVVDVEGVRVLVDPASLPAVRGATVDFVADPLRPGFRVDPPVPGTDPADPLATEVREVLEKHVNPGVAAHG